MCRLLACLIVALVALTACSRPKLSADMPPDQLYQRALDAMADEDWREAREILEKIQDDHPFSRYAVEAELLEADLAYDQKQYQEAAAAYRSFEELHPTHPKVSYALFRRGMSYMKMSMSKDRDQTATRNAVEAFEKLLYAYPESDYAATGSDELTEARARLAAHELYVARYYVRRHKVEAAIERLQYLVQRYPDSPSTDEALKLALELQTQMQARGNP